MKVNALPQPAHLREFTDNVYTRQRQSHVTVQNQCTSGYILSQCFSTFSHLGKFHTISSFFPYLVLTAASRHTGAHTSMHAWGKLVSVLPLRPNGHCFRQYYTSCLGCSLERGQKSNEVHPKDKRSERIFSGNQPKQKSPPGQLFPKDDVVSGSGLSSENPALPSFHPHLKFQHPPDISWPCFCFIIDTKHHFNLLSICTDDASIMRGKMSPVLTSATPRTVFDD